MDCRCEKDHCYAILPSKTPPVLPLFSASYHEVGSFPAFSCFTPIFTPFNTNYKLEHTHRERFVCFFCRTHLKNLHFCDKIIKEFFKKGLTAVSKYAIISDRQTDRITLSFFGATTIMNIKQSHL